MFDNVCQVCGEEKLLGHLGVVLYEYLGEEYPEVLGSILGGLKAVVNVIGMHKMTPPIKDLLPRFAVRFVDEYLHTRFGEIIAIVNFRHGKNSGTNPLP